MADTGASPRKSWRRSAWARAIGTFLALLVIWLTWLQPGHATLPPLVAAAVSWMVLVLPIYDHSRHSRLPGKAAATVFIAIVGGLFVWSVVRDALVGWNYGFGGALNWSWSSDAGVFRTELILALCAAIVTLVSVWGIARSSRATGQIVMWLGLGILGLGILSYGVAQTGFQVVAPMMEASRPEWSYVFWAVIGAVIGGLMAFIGAAFTFMKGAEARPSEAE